MKQNRSSTIIKVGGAFIFAFLFLLPVTSIKIQADKPGDSVSSPFDQFDLIKPTGPVGIPLVVEKNQKVQSETRSALCENYPSPDYSFIREPTPIITSYYDYMPSGFTSYPLKRQTQNGNGEYLWFHAKPKLTGNRQSYYAYVNNDNQILLSNPVARYNPQQGFGGIVIHPATGDCIATWHENADSDSELETAITYDDYKTNNTPGHWQTPLIFNDLPPNNFMWWPLLYIGPSPYDGYVRIYQITMNGQPTNQGFPCENVQIRYTDIINENNANLSQLLNLSTWNTVNVFSNWREKVCRPFQSFAIDYNHPGKVAFIGDAMWLDGDLGNMPVDEGAFVWESLDYGATWSVANLHSDGPGANIYQVNNPGFSGAPAVLNVTIAGWHNTAEYDSEGNLHWTFMQSYGYSDASGKYYFSHYLPQAEMVWNGTSFTFHEVPQLQGIDSFSGHSVPWDDNQLYPTITWSTYPNPNGITQAQYYENTQMQAINKQNGWIAQIWVDGTKAQLGADGDPIYAAYIHHPIIYLSISPDNGNTWSEPIQLTDINNNLFDFSHQITVYPYVCDQIVDLGHDNGRIDLMYFNDNDFGSYIMRSGPNTGGQIMYCSINVHFPGNHPPSVPQLPLGPIKGLVKTHYDFTTITTDVDGDQVFYKWDWGDGIISDWIGPYDSGAVANGSHQWLPPMGNTVLYHIPETIYSIRVKARDIYGSESEWSQPHAIRIYNLVKAEPEQIEP